MSLTAGALSKVSVGSTTDSVLAAAATGGTGPYTYQWYRSTTTGFTPGSGNLLSGATALALSDSGLAASTSYFYKMISTDTGNSNVTVTSAQLAVNTVPVQSQNQFSQSSMVGMTDMKFNAETIAVQVDASQSGSLYSGSAVKMVDSAGGIPKVIGCSADSDEVIGFINYDIKSQAYNAGDKCEISQGGNIMYLMATGAISRGAQVTLDIIYNGGVGQLVGSSGNKIVGWALDKATAAGQPIRVKLKCPSFTVA